MRGSVARVVLLIGALVAAGCATTATLRGPAGDVRVPHVREGALELVAAGDTVYAAADPAGATGVTGEGRVIRPYVVRLTRDLPVYRLWAGPDVKDAQGRTSRIGQWWTFEPPSGKIGRAHV